MIAGKINQVAAASSKLGSGGSSPTGAEEDLVSGRDAWLFLADTIKYPQPCQELLGSHSFAQSLTKIVLGKRHVRPNPAPVPRYLRDSHALLVHWAPYLPLRLHL